MVEPVLRRVIHFYDCGLPVTCRWRIASNGLDAVDLLHVANSIRVYDEKRRRWREEDFELQPCDPGGAGGKVFLGWGGIDFVAKGNAEVCGCVVKVEGCGFGVVGEVVVAGGVGAGGAVDDGGAVHRRLVGETGKVV